MFPRFLFVLSRHIGSMRKPLPRLSPFGTNLPSPFNLILLIFELILGVDIRIIHERTPFLPSSIKDSLGTLLAQSKNNNVQIFEIVTLEIIPHNTPSRVCTQIMSLTRVSLLNWLFPGISLSLSFLFPLVVSCLQFFIKLINLVKKFNLWYLNQYQRQKNIIETTNQRKTNQFLFFFLRETETTKVTIQEKINSDTVNKLIIIIIFFDRALFFFFFFGARNKTRIRNN